MTVTNQTETRQIKVLRTPLHDFPDVIIHAMETAVKKHPRYKEAKSGDSEAAFELVAHTGANGFGRLARQPFFEGAVTAGQDYVLVDDFVGMGGTLANLRGYIEAQGGKVIGAVTLTGTVFS